MATHTIYDYMKTQNRPYSVNDIVRNLHNEYSKAVVQQTMDQLVADGKVYYILNNFIYIYVYNLRILITFILVY